MTILCIYHKVDRDRTYYVKCGTIWYFRIGRYRYTIFVTMRHITPKPGGFNIIIVRVLHCGSKRHLAQLCSCDVDDEWKIEIFQFRSVQSIGGR